MRPSPAAPSLRVFYFLLIGVGSLIAHLVSEFAAMGSDANSVFLSPRHWYLGLSAVIGIGLFLIRGQDLLLRSSSSRDLKRILRVGLDELPFGGRGPRFYALTAGLQLGIGLLTQIGEGCPLCGHDVLAGVLGALFTVLVLAAVTRAIGHKLPSLVNALAGLLPYKIGTSATTYVAPGFTRTLVGRDMWSAHLFSRPPPNLQFLNASS